MSWLIHWIQLIELSTTRVLIKINSIICELFYSRSQCSTIIMFVPATCPSHPILTWYHNMPLFQIYYFSLLVTLVISFVVVSCSWYLPLKWVACMAVHMTIKRVLDIVCTIASTVLSNVEICWDLFESTFLSFAVMQNIVLREMVCKNQLSPGTHNMHWVFILSF